MPTALLENKVGTGDSTNFKDVENVFDKPAPPPNRTSPIRVLFIHPACPSQFTTIAAELNRDPAFECYEMLQYQQGSTLNLPDTSLTRFGFIADGSRDQNSYPYATAYEEGVRNARGILQALTHLDPQYHFDAVIGHAGFGATLGLRSLLKCAIISYAELPGYQAASARLDFPLALDHSIGGYASEALIYASLAHSELGIVPSVHARQLFPSGFQSKIRVQMEGFDLTALPVNGRAERQALNLPVEAKLVGFFGRTLEAVRGFDTFIHVARRLHDQDCSLRFVVIGEDTTIYGNEKTYLGQNSFKNYVLAQAGISAELFTWLPNLPYPLFRRYIACLDLAILPFFEGAGNWSLFEGMAVGLPILTSNRCFVPEVIRDGQEGILLNPYDIGEFARQAGALLNDPARAKSLGVAARLRVEQNYSITAAAKGYRRIIEEALTLKSGVSVSSKKA